MKKVFIPLIAAICAAAAMTLSSCGEEKSEIQQESTEAASVLSEVETTVPETTVITTVETTVPETTEFLTTEAASSNEVTQPTTEYPMPDINPTDANGRPLAATTPHSILLE